MPELLGFIKNLLGFYGSEADDLLAPLVLSAEQYLLNAGVKIPTLPDGATLEQRATYERECALYKIAVATQVKILHDGDIKGDLGRTLAGIIIQLKDYAGGEVI